MGGFSTQKSAPVSIGAIVGSAITELNTALASTAIIPVDATIPTYAEGTEVFTVTYTPKYADSKLIVTVNVAEVSWSSGQHMCGALFRDASGTDPAINVSRLGAGSGGGSYAGFGVMVSEELAVAKVSTTFHFRFGANTAGSVSLNGNYGIATRSFIKVEEIRQ